MPQLLCFSNPGEIDPRLITILGIHAKDIDNPIGYFGTGLKYALASTLRLGGKITIQSGETEYFFRPVSGHIRGKDFTFIEMLSSAPIEAISAPLPAPTAQTLGFTTDLGKNWQPWMVYRELWSNMRDEGGTIDIIAEMPEPSAGLTRIIVDCVALYHIHASPKDWLLPSLPLLWETPVLQCFAGNSNSGFYHGLKVCSFQKQTSFTYNIVDQQILTEDRTIDAYAYINVVTHEVMSKGKPSIPPAVLQAIIAPSVDKAENDFYWPTWIRPRDEIVAAAADGPFNPNLRRAIAAYLPPPPPGRTRFHDLDENGPVIPSHTCPDINALQYELLNLAKNLRHAVTTSDVDIAHLQTTAIATADTIDDLISDRLGPDSALENLRTMNETLREVGIYWRTSCKNLCKNLPSLRHTAY